MKLLAKFNRTNILVTIAVFLIGGFCYYLILQYVLLDHLDSDLKVEEQEITDYIHANNRLPNPANYKDQIIEFAPTNEPVVRKIKSIDTLNSKENEYVSIRQLVFSATISGKYYQVSISKTQEETEDLIQLIVPITLGLVVFLLIILFIINHFILNKLWHPFNVTLGVLKQFNLNSNPSIQLKDNNISEFKELNNAVSKMSKRVLSDYEALKSFTENASHEIQTPIAIVSSKLELLMQSESFTETQMQDIQIIHDEIRRLSKLNQSLLLLTKIDNQQFQETEPVDLGIIINKRLYNYEELIASKGITLTQNIKSPFTLLMNEIMAEVLVSNLITNAIKHNTKNGTIHITLDENQLTISNTGSPLTTNPDELFERFKKDKANSESLGLGLAIVKKICEQYNFAVRYDSTNSVHTLTIVFQ